MAPWANAVVLEAPSEREREENHPRRWRAGRHGPEPDPSRGSAELSPARGRALPSVLNGVRVLVVDDDRDSAELFEMALRVCGAEVRAFNSATAALSVCAVSPPDVVVTDLAMPGADGYWLVRQIRQLPDERARSVPVLAVTAFGREHVRARALAAGFVEHLVKPIDPEDLCLAVARALGR